MRDGSIDHMASTSATTLIYLKGNMTKDLNSNISHNHGVGSADHRTDM